MARPFSETLETWLKSHEPKTINSLSQVFQEKSFAITILLLMFLPALPLPTGGITHVFELITMLLALEMIIGRRTIWLPKRWQDTKLGSNTTDKALPFITRRIRWVERFSRPRSHRMLTQPMFLRLAGVLILIFAIGAFLAPPFSGFDTLPALGAVAVALSLILEDIVVFIAGVFIGVIGLASIVLFGTLLAKTTLHLIN